MSEKFDVVVIGGGPGGTPAAMQLAAQGKKVLLAEASGKLGGACLFVGCIPSKIIKHGADKFRLKKTVSSNTDSMATWKDIRANMEKILGGRSSAALAGVEQAGIRFIPGTATFVSSSEIEINQTRYSFDKAIISTGATSFVPPFQGSGTKDVLTSEVLFDLQALPASLMIVGGGPIGVELAQMLTALDVRCTIVEMMDTLLSGVVEPEFSQEITREMKDGGIQVFTKSKVEVIDRVGSRFQTQFRDQSGVEHKVETDKVLVVTGKVANVGALNLSAAGIKVERGGIVVNDYLETSVPGIYATGDVIQGGPKFAHVATYEAHIAAANIISGNQVKTDFTTNAWVLFSSPEIAAAGMTEAQAIKAGFDVVTGVYNYKIDATSQINEDLFGFMKYIVEKKTKKILGIHLFLNGAAQLSGEASIIVAQQMTLPEVARTIQPHPTLCEAFSILAFKMLADPALRG
ncbi:MAG: NAD(P)/FAD-dependent oxidoreductase [Spirochaetales bacterium]|nr:NAD(P)/FAD-dependent oxidoreductase [Spirochaetales bacterium]